MEIVEKEKLTVIYEELGDWWNGSCLYKLNEIVAQYKKEELLYFEEVAKITVTTEQIEGLQIASRMAHTKSVVTKINDYYGLEDKFALEAIPTGKNASSGFLKLINILGNIALHPTNKVVVVIEKIENNLHHNLRHTFIEHLFYMNKIEKLIFTTQEDYIMKFVKKDL